MKQLFKKGERYDLGSPTKSNSQYETFKRAFFIFQKRVFVKIFDIEFFKSRFSELSKIVQVNWG